jgi:hypothetical protein
MTGRRKSIVGWQTRCKSLPFPRPSDDAWTVPANLFDHSMLTIPKVSELLLKRMIPIFDKMNAAVYHIPIFIGNDSPRAGDALVHEAMKLLGEHDTVVIRGRIPEHAFVLLVKKNDDGDIETVLIDPNGADGDPEDYQGWKGALERSGNARMSIARIPNFNLGDDSRTSQMLRNMGIRATVSTEGYCATISWLFILDYVCAGQELRLDDVEGHFTRLYRDILRGNADDDAAMILYARSLGYHLCLLISDSTFIQVKDDNSKKISDGRKIPPPDKVQLMSVRRSETSIDVVKVGKGVTNTTAHKALDFLKNVQHINSNKYRVRRIHDGKKIIDIPI